MARFLVDQQLPHALAAHLIRVGHDARHVKAYPSGTTLDDAEIARIADAEDRAVMTKDEDFRISHLLSGRPSRLVHVTCGNISTADLLALVDRYAGELSTACADYHFVELTRGGVIIHDPA